MQVLKKNDAWMCEVKKDESTGEIYLEVMAGGFALYPMKKKLNSEQAADVIASDEKFIELAKRLAKTGDL